jgi:hypothetical protein
VDLHAPDIAIVRVQDLVEYRFTCPTCGTEVRKRADKKIVALLVTAGVEWSDVPVVLHPESPDVDAPPLTIDDLIDLHFELEEL